ncbi:hypothetical protein LSUE1_G010091 [Lachnellula suecica]|uniref:Uncharacterized protein n=1 Tax=Lachnellula suecica TaxID=602035 RepID=A0A8T9BW03_9HELO|nr:hypothetical protein LSUE1_G010091 [Lachnellula suecica]
MAPQESQPKKTLRETALQTNKTNPSQLGDPISLKAEDSNTSPTTPPKNSPTKDIQTHAPAPTEGDSSKGPSLSKSNQKPGQGLKDTKEIKNIAPSPTEGDESKGGKTLRQKAMQKLEENPSQLGDPVSLKAETADSEPTENDRGAGKSKL